MPDMSVRPKCERGTLPEGLGPDYCIPCSQFLQSWVRWDSHRDLVDQIWFLRKQVRELSAKLPPSELL